MGFLTESSTRFPVSQNAEHVPTVPAPHARACRAGKQRAPPATSGWVFTGRRTKESAKSVQVCAADVKKLAVISSSTKAKTPNSYHSKTLPSSMGHSTSTLDCTSARYSNVLILDSALVTVSSVGCVQPTLAKTSGERS
jgi:hypothetical protein